MRVNWKERRNKKPAGRSLIFSFTFPFKCFKSRRKRKPSPLFPSLISGGKLGEQLRTFPIHSPVNTTYSFILVHCQERRNDERKGETELSVNPQLSLNETVNTTYSFILVHCQERLSIPSFSFSSPEPDIILPDGPWRASFLCCLFVLFPA